MKILIATKNAGKIEGAKLAFQKFFDDVEIEAVNVESNVNEQPVNEETLQGAKNRVANLIKYANNNNIEAQYFVAIESGLVNVYNDYYILNFAVVKNQIGIESIGISCAFPVPNKYIGVIKEKGLGYLMDNLFNENELRMYKGGINILTKGKKNRIEITQDAFIMALTKLINNDLWRD